MRLRRRAIGSNSMPSPGIDAIASVGTVLNSPGGDDLALDRGGGQRPQLGAAALAVATGDLEPLLPASARLPRLRKPRLGSYSRGGRDPYVTPQRGWRMWWAKRRWYDRTHRFRNRWRINRHAARGGFYVRHPVEGEVLEALDDGRLTIGEGTLLEPAAGSRWPPTRGSRSGAAAS